MLQRIAMRRERGNANRHLHAQNAPVQLQRRRINHIAYALRDFVCHVGIDTGQQHGEFITAVACDDIAATGQSRQCIGNQSYGLIACVVAVDFIDRLKPLHIDHHNRIKAAGSRRKVVLPLRDLHEGAHVIQIGQLVTIGQRPDSGLREMNILGQQRRQEGNQHERTEDAGDFGQQAGRQRCAAGAQGRQQNVTNRDQPHHEQRRSFPECECGRDDWQQVQIHQHPGFRPAGRKDPGQERDHHQNLDADLRGRVLPEEPGVTKHQNETGKADQNADDQRIARRLRPGDEQEQHHQDQ